MTSERSRETEPVRNLADALAKWRSTNRAFLHYSKGFGTPDDPRLWQIVNAQDPYTLRATWRIGCLAVLKLGRGQYGLCGDEHHMPELIAPATPEDWFSAHFDESFESALTGSLIEVAEALDSVRLGTAEDRWWRVFANTGELEYRDPTSPIRLVPIARQIAVELRATAAAQPAPDVAATAEEPGPAEEPAP